MSVTVDTVRIVREAGNGSKTAFDFAFKIFAAGNIVAYKESSAGVYTLGVLNGAGATGYTVAFDSDGETGTVTWVTAPASGAFSVIIGNALAQTQETAIPREGQLAASSLRNTLDKLTILVQQLSEKLGRAAVQPLTPVNPTSITIQAPTAGRLLKYTDAGGGAFNITASSEVAASYTSGLLADRPAAPTAPAWYHATDDDQIFVYFSAAAGWKMVA